MSTETTAIKSVCSVLKRYTVWMFGSFHFGSGEISFTYELWFFDVQAIQAMSFVF